VLKTIESIADSEYKRFDMTRRAEAVCRKPENALKISKPTQRVGSHTLFELLSCNYAIPALMHLTRQKYHYSKTISTLSLFDI